MKITKALMVEQGLPWHIENGTFTPSEADVQYAIHNGVARQLGSADHFSYGTTLELLVWAQRFSAPAGKATVCGLPTCPG